MSVSVFNGSFMQQIRGVVRGIGIVRLFTPSGMPVNRDAASQSRPLDKTLES